MVAKSTLGARIEAARQLAGLNKNQLARAVATSWQHVDHWERDRMVPNGVSLQRLASVLGVSMGHLLGESGLAPASASSSAALELFVDRYAPPDITPEEIAWLRGAPIGASDATPGVYVDLLHRIRSAAPSAAPNAPVPAPTRTGTRVKAQPSAEAVRKARGPRR